MTELLLPREKITYLWKTYDRNSVIACCKYLEGDENEFNGKEMTDK